MRPEIPCIRELSEEVGGARAMSVKDGKQQDCIVRGGSCTIYEHLMAFRLVSTVEAFFGQRTEGKKELCAGPPRPSGEDGALGGIYQV